MTADYTYDRDADCFVVTDEHGNEICRTRSPHAKHHKFHVEELVTLINDGELIFPTPQQEAKV